VSEPVHARDARSVHDNRAPSGARSLRRLVAVALTALIATAFAVVGPWSASPAFAAWQTAGQFANGFDCDNTGAGGIPDRWNDYQCVFEGFDRGYTLWVETTSRRDLRLFWSHERGDSQTDILSDPRPEYSFVATLGKILVTQATGTVPLHLYWSHERGDSLTTTATSGGDGYMFSGTLGYVYSAPHWGTCPLRLYFNPQRADNHTTTSASGGEGYSFVATVGHILC
jgi:hypothetical protein